MAAPKAQAESGEQDEGTVDMSKTSTEKPAKKEKRQVRRPTYGLEEVEAIPEAPAVVRGREELFVQQLAPMTENPGKLYRVAHYATPTGAEKAAEALTNGERKLPGGTEASQWEFTGVKVENPDTEGGPRHSELFAKFLG